MKTRFLTIVQLAILSAAAGLMVSCETLNSSRLASSRQAGNQRLDPNHPALLARNAQIAAEAPGNYFIGRRYWIEGKRFWGFVRKPGQPWDDAPIVMMNETRKHQPDRLPEVAVNGARTHGYDHNYEYRLSGFFSGEPVYDPNSDQVLPEFVLTDYELLSSSPGFLFHPNQKFEKLRIPKAPVY